MADWWPRACETQGWRTDDREKRLEVLSEAVGRQLQSANDLDNSADIDQVKAHLGMLADDVERTVEVQNEDPGYRRRLLWLITKHSHPLGGLVYACALARDKFHITAGLSTIEDLTTDQLHQLMITLNARRRAKAKISRPAPELQTVTSNEPF